MTFYKALNFLFPQKCQICFKKGNFEICENCIKRIRRFEDVHICKFQNMNLDKLIYFFRYEGYIRKLILDFKFFNKFYIGKIFSKIMLKNEKLCGNFKFYDIIIPVPMYKLKKCERGYNQTEILAEDLATNLNVYYDKNILLKVINNRKQSSLSKEDRRENIKNVFKIENSDKITNKRIILIDDICTTFSTLEECSRILKEAGAAEVTAVVIAKD